MLDVRELKFTVSKIDNVARNKKVMGLVFYDFVFTKRSHNVVTDRLLASDEGVRVLDVRR